MTIYSNQAEGSIKTYRCLGFLHSTTIFWSQQTTFGCPQILQNDAPRGKSRDRSLATVPPCSSTDWVSLQKLRTQPVNSRGGHLPKDVKLTMWGYSSLICNLIATTFSAATAAWGLLLKRWLPKQEISKKWSVVKVNPRFQIHVHVAYMLNEAVHTPLGQHQATPEPNSDILGSPHWRSYAHTPDIRL